MFGRAVLASVIAAFAVGASAKDLIFVNNMSLKQEASSTSIKVGYMHSRPADIEYVMFQIDAVDKNGKPVKPKKTNSLNQTHIRMAFMPYDNRDNVIESWDKLWPSKDVVCAEIVDAEVIFKDGEVTYIDKAGILGRNKVCID